MNWDIKLTKPQDEFIFSEARYPAFVGGWGCGKTTMLILKAMMLSEMYPENQGVILRKSFTDLKDSTMSDFTKYTGIKVRSDKRVTLPNGSIILFHHLDELSGIAQNINLGWFGIEQAEEMDSDKVFELLRGRLRRDNVGHVQGFLIANTNGHNWMWRKWKSSPPSDQYHLVEATPFDNPHLREDFVEDLKTMEIESPSHYRRFVLNSWEDTDTADKIIPYQKILEAVDRDIREYDNSMKVIACDPAEYGDDKTVIYYLEGYKVKEFKILSKKSLMETAGHVVAMHRKHGADKIIIDDIGVGAGVRASLKETLDYNDTGLVMGFNSGRVPMDKQHYVRSRDEIWGHAAKLFKDDYVSIPDDPDLVEDLGAVTYALNSKGQMMIARKKDIKKVLGHSPDRADALVMGLWASAKGKKRELAYSGFQEEYDPLTFGL